MEPSRHIIAENQQPCSRQLVNSTHPFPPPTYVTEYLTTRARVTKYERTRYPWYIRSLRNKHTSLSVQVVCEIGRFRPHEVWYEPLTFASIVYCSQVNPRVDRKPFPMTCMGALLPCGDDSVRVGSDGFCLLRRFERRLFAPLQRLILANKWPPPSFILGSSLEAKPPHDNGLWT